MSQPVLDAWAQRPTFLHDNAVRVFQLR